MSGFDPRAAALNHASSAEEITLDGAPADRALGQLASAIACGLVYVGDQIAAAAPPKGPQPTFKTLHVDRTAAPPAEVPQHTFASLRPAIQGQVLELARRGPEWLPVFSPEAVTLVLDMAESIINANGGVYVSAGE